MGSADQDELSDPQDGSTEDSGDTSPPPEPSPEPAPASDEPEAAPQAEQGGAVPELQASISIDPDDGTAQAPNSIQVPLGASLTLSWSSTAAASVDIDPLGSGLAASGSQQVPTEDATYTLVAIGADGTRSRALSIDVHTHEDSEVISGHATISSGVAAVLSFVASDPSGSAVTHANVGDVVTLTATVSDSTESVTINGSAAPLTKLDSGYQEASLQVTIASGADGNFECQVLQGGEVAGDEALRLDIAPAPAAEPDADAGPATSPVDAAGADASAGPAAAAADGSGAGSTSPQLAAPSADLQISAGDSSAGGSEVTALHDQAITLTWTATGASLAQLACALAPQNANAEGTTDDNGQVRMEVQINASMPAKLTLLDGDTELGTWEFDLDDAEVAGEAPADLTASPATVGIGTLLNQPLTLPLDNSGNGQGTLVIDPGPIASAIFTLTVTAGDGSGDKTAECKVHVTNFYADLRMEDGSPAPANKRCKLELGLMAGNSDQPAGQAAA